MLDMIAGVFTGGGSTILSSLLGSVSGVVGHYYKAKEHQQTREHEKDLIKLNMERDQQESELQLAEIKANLEVTKTITEGELLKEEARGFNPAVMKISTTKTLHNKAFEKLLDGNIFQSFLGTILAFIMGLVDIIRGLIRPALTAASFGIMIYLVKTFAIGTDLLPEQHLLILTLVIDASVYVLTAATQFWFMDRAGARDFRKKH